jgi:hypothetical protein
MLARQRFSADRGGELKRKQIVQRLADFLDGQVTRERDIVPLHARDPHYFRMFRRLQIEYPGIHFAVGSVAVVAAFLREPQARPCEDTADNNFLPDFIDDEFTGSSRRG